MQGLGKQKCQAEEEILKRKLKRRKRTDRINSNLFFKLGKENNVKRQDSK